MLNSRSILDPRWPFAHRRVASGLQICDIDIYDENLSSRVYNATSNTWDSTSTSVWSGKARIQQMKSSSARSVSGDPTFVREVEMQIDFSGTTIADIRPGNYIFVTTSPIDATLTNFVYIVRSVINSSNPWQRTLMCEVDMEADPNA